MRVRVMLSIITLYFISYLIFIFPFDILSTSSSENTSFKLTSVNVSLINLDVFAIVFGFVSSLIRLSLISSVYPSCPKYCP